MVEIATEVDIPIWNNLIDKLDSIVVWLSTAEMCAFLGWNLLKIKVTQALLCLRLQGQCARIKGLL